MYTATVKVQFEVTFADDRAHDLFDQAFDAVKGVLPAEINSDNEITITGLEEANISLV